MIEKRETLFLPRYFKQFTVKIDERLKASRVATSGKTRLKAYIEAWGNYIPEIYGVGRVLMAVSDTDEAACAAWTNRMQAVRHGCAAAINALDNDGQLSDDLTVTEAVRRYRLAADQGLALAQSNLGLMYDNGRGVPDGIALYIIHPLTYQLRFYNF
ncbi:MAG: hypothetical protein ACKVIX_03750 [Sphingomonadales bacterium]